MNKTYRLIWSAIKEVWMAVSEKVRDCGARPGVTVGTLAAAVLAAGGAAFAVDPGALPTGGRITAGSGTINQSGSQMTINQASQQMIANWSTFNIGQNAGVRFNQPNSAATALNRIQDQNPTQILGSLSANGKVFLLNPSGIIFGRSARVDVGGLVASSLDLADSDFMAGRYRFGNPGNAGGILNQGSIGANGGVVALIAPKVQNEGAITTKGGSTVLAAGNQVSVDFTGDGLVSYTVDQGAVDALAENRGLIKADGGMVVMTARAADSLTTAVVNNSGVIEASSLTAKGGKIVLEGDDITLAAGSILNATGATGGGEVLVGGGLQGSGGHRQASAVTMDQGASIDVSATQKGDGGTAVLWSDIHDQESRTSAHGTILARGGVAGGDGGRIETSGHWLSVSGIRADASAAKGAAGEWLLDPYNVIIAGAGASGTAYAANYSPSADSTILASDIATSLEGGTSVTITTGSSGTSRGDITVNSAITKASGNTDVTLTMRAANSIALNQKIENTGGTGKLHVTLDADNDNGTADGGGIVILKSDIATNGGNLSFGTGRQLTINGVSTYVGGDVFVGGGSAQSISTNGGTVDVKGEMLIANTNGLTIASGGGNVRFYGLLNSANQYTFVDKSGAGETGSWSQARTEAINGTGGGSAVNDSYLVTITSRLENAVAGDAAGYTGAWIGAYRSDITKGDWVWSDGPEKDKKFFTQTASGVGGGSVVSGYYANFGTGEPNGTWSAGEEQVGQFFGTAGQWNDLGMATPYNEATADDKYKVRGFVRETNLAASPLTIDAGAGTVTFSGAVGTSKALASLNVTSTGGIAINGGAVTTEGAQTYTGNVTLGAASTVLTQTSANTDFTLQANKTITNAFGGNAGLTIKTTRDITLDSGSSISSSTGALNVTLNSDSDATGGGAIQIGTYNGAATVITSNGGDITLSGGTDIATGFAQGRDSVKYLSNGVYFGNNASLNSNGGNITIRGKGALVEGATDVAACGAMGVWGFGNTSPSITGGAGKVSIYGVAQSTSTVNPNSIGVYWEGSGVISSNSTAADAITIIGDASTVSNNHYPVGVAINNVQAMNGGGISITGYGGTTTNSGAHSDGVKLGSTSEIKTTTGSITITGTRGGSLVGTNVGIYLDANKLTSTSGNITLNADTLGIVNTSALQSSGILTIQPLTAGKTIGIAGGTGDIQLTATNFSTNFVNGFSGITVGNATAGLVTVGSSALSYNDPLTIKTGNSIFFGGSSALTGNGNNLVLWSRAGGDDAATDATAGAVWLPVGSSISTGGGSVTIGGGSNPATGYALGDSGAGSAENNARYRGVTVNGTIDAGGGAVSILGKGAPNAAARGISIGGAVATTGSGTITMSGIAHGVSDGLALGDNTVGLNGTVSALNGLVSLSGTKDTGSNGINVSTAGSAITVSGTGSLALTATGAINGAGYVQAGGTTSLDAGSNAITLANAANDFTGTVSVVSGTNVSLIDSNAMTLGAVTATGTVDIATLTNDLTLTGAIATTNATTNAIKLNAGKNTAAGTSTGGNILISGGSASISTDGTATLYTGSVSGSTGMKALIGSGSGKFRYNSDESATNYTDSLGTGVYAVYRERPLLSVTPGSASMTYGAAMPAFSKGYGGYANGDTSAGTVSGTATWTIGGSTSSSGNYTAGSHNVSYNSGLTSSLGYGFTDNAASTNELTVSKATLTTTGATAQNKVYDGTTAAIISGASLVGTVSGDTVTVSGNGTFGDKTAENGKTVTATLALGGGDAGNYELTQPTGLTADISKLALTGSITAGSSTYGAPLTPGSATFTNAISGDNLGTATVTVDTAGNTSSSGNLKAGSYSGIESVTTLSGPDAANYTFSGVTGDYTVVKRSLGLDLQGQGSKVYDGTTAISLSGITPTVTGVVSGDAVAVATGTVTGFADKNAGSNKEVTFTGFSLSDTDAANYQLVSGSAAGTAAITKATLTTSGATAQNKVYDGTTAATITGESLVGVFGTDVVTISGDGTFDDKNAGNGKTITAALALGGADAGNYDLTQPTGLAADITKATLTTTGATAQNKVYDGNTAATITGESLVGVIGADVVTISGGGTFYDKNAGNGKTVTAALALGGGDAGNYELTQPTGLTADISKLALTGSIAAGSSTYGAPLTPGSATFTNAISGDNLGTATVTVDTAGNTSSSCNLKAGSYSGIESVTALSGPDAANYTFSGVTGDYTVDKRSLGLDLQGQGSKVYDGTTAISLSGITPTVTGVVSGDAVAVATGTVTGFADKNAGSNKEVTFTGFALSDADAANYQLVSGSAAGTASITPAPLTITAAATNKTYDGTRTALATPTVSGLMASDTVSGLAEEYADKNAGTDKTVNVSAYTVNDGNNGGNYTVTTAAVTTGVIDKADATVTANSGTATYSGQAQSVDGFTASGLVAGETAGVLTGVTAGVSGINAGTYATTASGTDSNYNLSFVNGTLTIAPAPLTIIASDATKTYGQTRTFTGSEFTSSGLMNNETIGSVTLASTGAAATAEVAGSPYAITASDATGGTFNAGNYTIAYIDGVLTVTAMPAAVETVVASLTSIQHAVNGTQQGPAPNTSGYAPTLGPGSGSVSLAGLYSAQLVASPAQTTATTILASASAATPVGFTRAPDGGTTMSTISAQDTEPMTDVNSLPLFLQSAGSQPVIQGTFLVREGGSSLSLVPTTVTSPANLPSGIFATEEVPFTLSQTDGATLNFSAGVTSDGFLVILAPQSEATFDRHQAMLMAMTVVKRELKSDLKELKGILIRNTD